MPQRLAVMIATLFLCSLASATDVTGQRAANHQLGYKQTQLPQPFVKIILDNDLYYYSAGIFYRHLSNRYVVVEAPLGAKVESLPSGFARVSVDGVNFSYFEDTWFIWRPALQAYEVVANPSHQAIPAGNLSRLPSSQARHHHWEAKLPNGAQAVDINGAQYFEHNGIYYEPLVVNGSLGYRKVRL